MTEPADQLALAELWPCTLCHGSGRDGEKRCPMCQGAGSLEFDPEDFSEIPF